MADWSKPSLTDPYASVLTELMSRDVSTATLSYANDANIPNGAILWNPNNYQFEIYSVSGGNWSPWSPQLNIGTLLLGQNAAQGTMQAMPRQQADAAYQPAGSYAALEGNAEQPFAVAPGWGTQAAQRQQVQSLLGSYSQAIPGYKGGTLTLSQTNSYVQLYGNVTLPENPPAGSTFVFKNDNPASSLFIYAPSGCMIYSPAQGVDSGATEISLAFGDDVLLVCIDATQWGVAGGTWLSRSLTAPYYALPQGNPALTFQGAQATEDNEFTTLAQTRSAYIPQTNAFRTYLLITTTSQTITLQPGWYKILLIGAGGGGRCGDFVNNNGVGGGGGGGGGVVEFIINLTETTNIPIVIGVGGAGGATPGAAGTAGTVTSFGAWATIPGAGGANSNTLAGIPALPVLAPNTSGTIKVFNAVGQQGVFVPQGGGIGGNGGGVNGGMGSGGGNPPPYIDGGPGGGGGGNYESPAGNGGPGLCIIIQ